jgi:GNAT superfamily N-acetyltransferase
MPDHLEIRAAQPADAELIFAMVCELAEYERAPDEVTGNPSMLREALFGYEQQCDALVAELGAEPVGFALVFGTFSTWECRPGMWIEDLYVREPHRRSGVGGELFRAVVALARDRGCARLEWAALRWNDPALRFYEKHGAKQLDEWVTYRLDGAGLHGAAQEAPRG